MTAIRIVRFNLATGAASVNTSAGYPHAHRPRRRNRAAPRVRRCRAGRGRERPDAAQAPRQAAARLRVDGQPGHRHRLGRAEDPQGEEGAPRRVPNAFLKSGGRWQISFYSPGMKPKEIGQVYVVDATAKVSEAWTGFQVAWTMARGYPGAFGAQGQLAVGVDPAVRAVPAAVLRVPPAAALLHLDLLVLVVFSGLAGVLQRRRDRPLGAARLSAARSTCSVRMLLGRVAPGDRSRGPLRAAGHRAHGVARGRARVPDRLPRSASTSTTRT